LFIFKYLIYINKICCSNTIQLQIINRWYRARRHHNTEPIPSLIPSGIHAWGCLTLPDNARRKNGEPHKYWLPVVSMPVTALCCQAANHSHSMVAGGLLDTSYTTRLMPRTSLMMRDDTLASSGYGSCAQSAVMKSDVCTARSAT